MKFTETHEWIKTYENVGTIGVTNFAQKELGDIVYVELPKVGKMVKSGEEIAVLESTKAAADVYSPVSGIITEINQVLNVSPDLINKSAEEEGWICKVKLSDEKELDSLMDIKMYQAKVGSPT